MTNFHLLFVLLAFTHFCSYFSEITANVKPIAHGDSAATSNPDRSGVAKDKSGGEAKSVHEEHKVTNKSSEPDESHHHDKYDKVDREKATPSPLQRVNDGQAEKEETMDGARQLHAESGSDDTGKLPVTPGGKMHDSVDQMHIAPNEKASQLHAADSKSENGNGSGKAHELKHEIKLGDKAAAAAAKSKAGEGAEEEKDIMDDLQHELATESGIVKQGGEKKHVHAVSKLQQTNEEGETKTGEASNEAAPSQDSSVTASEKNGSKPEDTRNDAQKPPGAGDLAQLSNQLMPKSTGGVGKTSTLSTTVIYVFVITCIVFYIDKLDLYA